MWVTTQEDHRNTRLPIAMMPSYDSINSNPRPPAEMTDDEIDFVLWAHARGIGVQLDAGYFGWVEWDGVNLHEAHQRLRLTNHL